MTKQQKIGLILGPALFAFILFLVPVQGELTEVGKKVLASMVWMIIWWSTQPVTLGQTALLPVLLFPALGLNDAGINATSGYVHTAVLLTTSVFWLGSAIEKWNLHRRIAFTILSVLGTKPLSIMMSFAFATGIISMWMSNTASTAMMIPIVAALTISIGEYDKNYGKLMGAALMLTVAFSATNGGTATPIGNNANIVGIGIIEEMTGVVIDFPSWMIIAVPICMMMILVSTYIIYRSMGLGKVNISIDRKIITEELHKLGTMSTGERHVLIVLAFAILSWITKTFWSPFLPFISDHMIGGFAVAILFLWPVNWKTNEPTLDFKYAVSHTSWDAVFLIGGSLVLGSAFADSGLTDWIAAQMAGFSALPEFVLIIVLAVIASLVTELGSNIVVAAVFIPIAASIAKSAGYAPMLSMVNIIFACGFAYMLPQGTPPNALAAGSGLVENKQMLKTGTLVKVVILILYPIMYFGADKLGLVRF
ncbi:MULTISPECIES: DASS family sodium-coupled anion symporter [unclassified Clostridium]|jgi:sodium-dependent dicarboxylate transporter 2/3/5|uniref:SLC13 family permease n=1 Tax=unclassified Clostridium TaxID=2614128 RepID=UPI001106EA0A|nr:MULTISPECIES: DASS family sodium-coupled anion symporter [unclassified Clostridium]